MIVLRFDVRRIHAPSLHGAATWLAVTVCAGGDPDLPGRALADDWRARALVLLEACRLAPPETAPLAPPGGPLAGFVVAVAAVLAAAALARVEPWPDPPAGDGATHFLSDMPDRVAVAAMELALAILVATARGKSGSAAELQGRCERLQTVAEAATRELVDREGVIIDACAERAIPCRRSRADRGQLVIGEGRRQIRFSGTCPLDRSAGFGTTVTQDKLATKAVLQAFGVPVLSHRRVASVEEAVEAASEIGFPVAVKPTDGSRGAGAALDQRSADEVARAFPAARSASPSGGVMVERYLESNDYRCLIAAGALHRIYWRRPPYVVGDGRSSIAELIAVHDAEVAAGRARFPARRPIKVDDDLHATIARGGHALDSVLAEGERLVLRRMPLRPYGGYSTDVTARAHPETIALFLRIVAIFGLPVAAIDLRAADIERSWHDGPFAVLEVNARPNTGGPEGALFGAAVVERTVPDPAAMRMPVLLVLLQDAERFAAAVRGRLGDAVDTAGIATPHGVWLAGIRVDGDGSVAGAQDRISEDRTLAAALHCVTPDQVRSHGLGLPLIDQAFLGPGTGGPVADLVSRVARRCERFGDGDGVEAVAAALRSAVAGTCDARSPVDAALG